MTLMFMTTGSLLSGAIRWITKSRASHVGVGSTLHGVPVVLHAVGRGVVLDLRSDVLRKKQIVREFSVSVSGEDVRRAVLGIGQRYDKLGLVGYLLLVAAWRWLRIYMRNVFASPSATVCSEFVTLLGLKEWRTLDPERTVPQDLLSICERHPDRFRRVV